MSARDSPCTSSRSRGLAATSATRRGREVEEPRSAADLISTTSLPFSKASGRTCRRHPLLLPVDGGRDERALVWMAAGRQGEARSVARSGEATRRPGRLLADEAAEAGNGHGPRDVQISASEWVTKRPPTRRPDMLGKVRGEQRAASSSNGLRSRSEATGGHAASRQRPSSPNPVRTPDGRISGVAAAAPRGLPCRRHLPRHPSPLHMMRRQPQPPPPAGVPLWLLLGGRDPSGPADFPSQALKRSASEATSPLDHHPILPFPTAPSPTPRHRSHDSHGRPQERFRRPAGRCRRPAAAAAAGPERWRPDGPASGHG
jgi:hypothetical protein